MGAADGVSAAAPAPATGQPFEWRRTPISGNGTSTNPDSADKESRLTPGWEHLLGLTLKEDWNRMVVVPMAGWEYYDFKELIRVGPGLLEDMGNPLDLMSDPTKEPSCHHHFHPAIKYCFVDGPVFKNCRIDPLMFYGLSLSSPENLCPFWDLCTLEDDKKIQKIGGLMNQGPVGQELEGFALIKLENRFVIHPESLPPSRQLTEVAPPEALGYQPTNMEAEFPDLGDASASIPKEPVVKKHSYVQNTPPQQVDRQENFDNRNKRANLIGNKYLSDQLNKVIGEKKTTAVEKEDDAAKPSTSSTAKSKGRQRYYHRNRGYQHQQYSSYFPPHQPIVLLRGPQPGYISAAAMERRGGCSVINDDGITNNFQASHGYRQWKRVKEDSSSDSGNSTISI